MNRKLIAVSAAVPFVFGAVFGATPALAAEGDSPVPTAEATPAPTAVLTADPSADQSTPAPTSVPTDSPAPIATDAPTPDPASKSAAPTPEPTSEPAAPTAAPAGPTEPAAAPAPVAAPAPAVVPVAKATVAHVGWQETGYTNCWDMYPDQPGIDPYDKRTWPDGVDCFPSQATNAAISADVTSVNQSTGHAINYSFAGNSQTGSSPFEDIDAHMILPGQTIVNRYAIKLAFPALDTKPIIDRDGSTIPRDVYALDARQDTTGQLRFWIGNPKIAASPYVSHSLSCDPLPTGDVFGTTLETSCTVTITVSPDLPLSTWYSDNWGSPFGYLNLAYTYEAAFDGPQRGDGTDFSPVSPTSTFLTQLNWPASPAWAPSADDHQFRVKAKETLTVTPSGLLTGAQWNEGNVDELNTYITNVPTGGAVTPQGNLEFTSEQVGDYAFNYYLQDPKTGLRSADATGNIEVYDSAQPSCFAGPPAQAGTSYPDLPDDPAPVRFSGKVGEPLHFTTRDLVNGTAWVDSYLRDISQLPGLDYSGPVDDMQLEWTPKEAGVVTFTYALGTQNCTSKVYTATIDVAPADAVVVAPPASDPPALIPAVPLLPAPVAPAAAVTPQLAHTGSNTDGSGIAFIALLAIGLGATAAAVARRRSRSSSVVGEDT